MKNEEYIKAHYNWEDYINIVHKLRQPDGCPWDSTQTFESMKNCIKNEADEVVAAIEKKDYINLREELGDLLLQVVMYSDMASDKGEFTLEDVINEAAAKMIRRHPHVFNNGNTQDTSEIEAFGVSRWNAIKFFEKVEHLKEYEKQADQKLISRDIVEFRREELIKFCEKSQIPNEFIGKMLQTQ